MDEKRAAETVTEAALDRKLARALAVDPSPEFVARVRARIAREPAPSPWSTPRVVVAAGAAAMAIAIVVALGHHDRKSTMNPETRVSAPTLVAQVQNSAAAAPAALTVPSRATKRHVTSPRMAPEVIVSPDEARGLYALLIAASEGRADFTTLLDERTYAGVEPQPPLVISISPITIEPIEGTN